MFRFSFSKRHIFISVRYTLHLIAHPVGQESTLAHYLVEQAQLLGLHSYVDDVGNWVASTHSFKGYTGSQPIILLGHMDTVSGYIPVRIQDGVLFGRGAVDAKGPLAAFLSSR